MLLSFYFLSFSCLLLYYKLTNQCKSKLNNVRIVRISSPSSRRILIFTKKSKCLRRLFARSAARRGDLFGVMNVLYINVCVVCVKKSLSLFMIKIHLFLFFVVNVIFLINGIQNLLVLN